ncbi:MAG: CDP-alcohol phosphatidyltransferase family protein [Actinomycetota bacterium]|nr:CDP-alcohol phosphatidyltransferase family protein [Actinomycetota bacterium]
MTQFLYRPISTRIASLLARTGVSPLTVTWVGVAVALLAAVLLGGGYYVAGAAAALVAEIVDCVDGDLARATDRSSTVGAFLDSVLDRWMDAALILGLTYSDLDSLAAVGGLALTASLLTSYTRARAQSLGVDCPEGIGARDSRLLILIVSALAGVAWWGLLLIAVTGFVTSIQRAVIGARRLGARVEGRVAGSE